MFNKEAPFTGRFFYDKFVWCIGFCALFVSFFVPLHFPPWLSWHSEMLVIAGVMLTCCAMLAKRVTSGRALQAVALPRSVVVFAALPAVMFLQWMFGQLPYGGDVLIIGFYAALCVVCLALGFESGNDLQRHNPCKVLAWILLAAGFGSTVIALVQVLDVWTGSQYIVRGYSPRRPGANLAQPNHLALLLTMAIASLAYIRMDSNFLGKWVSVVLFILLATGLAITESRAGLLQLWVLAVLFSLKSFPAEPNFSQALGLFRWQVASCVLLATGLFVGYPTVFGLLNGVEGTTGRMTEGSMRFVVWPQLVDAVMLRPWLGWGMLQVAPAHNAVAHAYPVTEAFHYSHNIFLDFAIWLGLPAAVCLSMLTAMWLLRHLVKAQAIRSVYALALILVFGIAATLEYQHAYTYFLAPAAFAMGVLERVHGAKQWEFFSARVALVAVVAMTGLMAWSAVEYFALEEDIRIVRFQASRIGSTPQGYEAPRTLLLTQLSALANNSRIKVMPDMTQTQLAALQNTALRYPWTATQSRYALALAMNGNISEGQRQLHVMRAQHGTRIFLLVVDELNLQLKATNSSDEFSSVIGWLK